MAASPNPERFIASTFRSVWSLEVLLYLRASPETVHRREELVGQLRASEAVIAKSIEALLAAGLIVEEDEGAVRYAPAGKDLEGEVAEAERLYRAKPDAVRRLIVAASAGGIAAFADAFRLKGD